MSNPSRNIIWPTMRSMVIAAAPVFFLVLLGLWTLLNISVMSVKADPAPAVALTVVTKAAVNLCEVRNTAYDVLTG